MIIRSRLLIKLLSLLALSQINLCMEKPQQKVFHHYRGDMPLPIVIASHPDTKETLWDLIDLSTQHEPTPTTSCLQRLCQCFSYKPTQQEPCAHVPFQPKRNMEQKTKQSILAQKTNLKNQS